jgi:protein-tyrosine phosphatase
MDGSNLRDLMSLAASSADRGRIRMFRDFDPVRDEGLDVPDPWYGGQHGFHDVLGIVERTTDALVAAMVARWPLDQAASGK